MEPIFVPGPPKEAFNKNRPISDLVRNQVGHFKHIEDQLPQDVRAALPQTPIVTEDDAARYIDAMTRYLLTRPVAASPQIPKKVPGARRPVTMPRPGLALAAAAKTPARKKTASSKTTASKKKTTAVKKSSSSKPKAGSPHRKRTK